MLGGAGSPGGDELLTVTIVRDEYGYGMKVSGDNPVYVQSVKEHGAAWRAGLRAGDRILRVDAVPVHHHTHQEVVQMIRENATTVLTVQQNSSRHKTPITAPVPVNSEKQRQLEESKVHTMRLMLEQEQKYIRDLRNELTKVPDVRKQTQLESAELRCSKLQAEIDTITAGQVWPLYRTDNRAGVPVLHVRSRSSPEQLDHEMPRPCTAEEKESWERGTPPPGTPPPPYAHNTQPCADPQRAIISMEEDDSPASDNSTYSGLFSNLRSVRESKARTAVLLNWLLGERRCACASLLLILTDGYRAASGVPAPTLRRWAYEIQSTFLIPNAVLQLNGVDENMANEIEHVLVNEYDKEELLRNVFRKARQKAKEELSQQLTEFQVKRQVGLGTLYGPEDAVIEKCDVDKAQELIVVERLLCQRLSDATRGSPVALTACGAASAEAHGALLAALVAAALCLHCRPASVSAAVHGSRPSFLQRDKLYKQRVKQLAKQHPQPYVVRGHHLQLQALTSVGHCHHCDHVIWGLAPQAYVCTDCKLRVHRTCAKSVEEGCCLDGEHHNNRISRFMERIHPNNQLNNLDTGDKKSRKTSGPGHFLNMERSFRKMEDEQPWDQTLTPASSQGESRREGSAEEQTAPDADADTSDATAKEAPDKDNNWRAPPSSGRGVNRAESCRERDAPRRGKHRNASDPNRLTAHNNHDLEPGAATAPSGSSSSSSLSSRSNESNTVAAEQQASQSDLSEEEEPLAAQWADSLPAHALESLQLSSRLRKRQEVIHELIVSEGSHVRWLKVLSRVFLRPLESTPALLPADELRALFPNLPDVRDWHSNLHTQLRALRSNAPDHVVQLGLLADTMLGTLGDPKYAACVSRFCRGQRLALEALRERRRKNKDLHQWLASREQLPLCGRLQLRDLLACVWQRLTKYRLLLESVLKTVSEDEDVEEDVARLQRALEEAKYMLNSVDAAIRAAENEHRLRTIQSKLEVRIGGLSGHEWEEVRRLDLTQHSLRLEGELSVRNDSSKKISMLALMFEDMLVLLQREGEKFILKPIAGSAGVTTPRVGSAAEQRGEHAALLPLIKWDKVLFRPNAAVRNTFFLIYDINVKVSQMLELTANTTVEYTTWVNYIQEAARAKGEMKHSITPSHQASRSTDDSGINVSRNPSDASDKSNLTADIAECDRERASLDRTPAERDGASAERAECDRDKERPLEEERERPVEEAREEVKCEKEAEVVEKEEKHVPRRPTVGRISTHGGARLEPAAALRVRAPAALAAHTAHTAYTYQERLRRLDEGIRAALLAKSAIVGALLGVPGAQHDHLAELAVAETLGEVDIRSELRATRQSSRESSDEDGAAEGGAAEGGAAEGGAALLPDMRQLLLAAHAQANQLTESISRALNVNEAAVVAARSRRGRCTACRANAASPQQQATPQQAMPPQQATPPQQAAPPQHAVASVVTAAAPGLVASPHCRQSSGDAAEYTERNLDECIDSATELMVDSSLRMLEQSLSSEASFDMLGDLEEVRPTPEGNAEDALESNLSAAALAARLARPAGGLARALGAVLAALPAAERRRDRARAHAAAQRERADRLCAALQRATRGQHDYQVTDEIYSLKPDAEQPIQDQPSNGG